MPREKNNEIKPLTAKTIEMDKTIFESVSLLGFAIKYKILANPHQAIVVMCHAKRKVRLVNQSLPNSFGKLSRLNNRISMYFSPKKEWIKPIITSKKAPTNNNFLPFYFDFDVKVLVIIFHAPFLLYITR